MQGKKELEPKIFVNYCLGDYIAEDNFYRTLDKHLDLSFLYPLTREYYSHTGQPGLDPVVFFKLLLVAYLENICFDRALVRAIEYRMDIRYFIRYDIDEAIPDHSTICKTRKRIPEVVFDEVFNRILQLCIESGLVKGKTQAIDSAYINANASLDHMVEIKLIDRDPKAFLDEVRKVGDEDEEALKKRSKDRLKKHQKSMETFTRYRRDRYNKQWGGSPAKKNKRRFMSNVLSMSETDPDSRVAKKSGKPRMLCYTALIATDTENNVITHASAEFADHKDSRLLQGTVDKLQGRLNRFDLNMEEVLSDTGFSSGENYQALEEKGITGFIPPHGQYKSERPGFVFDAEKNSYTCRNGKELVFKKTVNSSGYVYNYYRTTKADCEGCPFRKECIGNQPHKKIQHTYYRDEYERMIERLNTERGKQAYRERKTTVEPAIGTLQQHMGLRYINVRGKSSAHKVIVMAACAYNLRKWIKTIMKPAKTTKMALSKALIGHFKALVDIYNQGQQMIKTLANQASIYA